LDIAIIVVASIGTVLLAMGTGIAILLLRFHIGLHTFLQEMFYAKEGEPSKVVLLGAEIFGRANTVGHRSLAGQSAADSREALGAKKEIIEAIVKDQNPLFAAALDKIMPDWARKAAKNPQLITQAASLLQGWSKPGAGDSDGAPDFSKMFGGDNG